MRRGAELEIDLPVARRLAVRVGELADRAAEPVVLDPDVARGRAGKVLDLDVVDDVLREHRVAERDAGPADQEQPAVVALVLGSCESTVLVVDEQPVKDDVPCLVGAGAVQSESVLERPAIAVREVEGGRADVHIAHHDVVRTADGEGAGIDALDDDVVGPVRVRRRLDRRVAGDGDVEAS